MTKKISVSALLDLMRSSSRWVLFDVRELGEAEAGQILGATFLPRRLIEFRIPELVPLKTTAIVVYDEGGMRAGHAAATLAGLGYTEVSVLDGGTAAWVNFGQRLTEGSNVPSKLFGELVHDQSHTPSVSASKILEWKQTGRPFLVCDIRTPEEYARSRIPGAYSTAGFDVGLCMPMLKDRSVPIVVNCAGRTRSIIACETLRNLGLNEVYALENGTMGWVLANQSLEKGEGAGPILPTPASRAAAHAKAMAMANSIGVVMVDAAQVGDWIAQRDRGEANIYLFDTRQTNEYDVGHIEGTAILPGALAVQRTDEFVPDRRGQIVFVDDDEARALLAAYWLRRMGILNVAVLKGGLSAWMGAGFPLTRGRRHRLPLTLQAAQGRTKAVSPHDMLAMMRIGVDAILYVDTSAQFEKGRIAGSTWIPRGWLEERIGKLVPDLAATLIVTCRDGQQSTLAAATLQKLGYRNVFVLSGGIRNAGDLPLREGADASIGEAKDVILPPYAKGVAGMRRYLEWETTLTRS